MTKIKCIERIKTGYSPIGTHYSKGDYIGVETNYLVDTNDGRQCAVSREGILSMLLEIGIEAVRISGPMLLKLIGHTLDSKYVNEECRRFN